jgi:hypothetical protein
MDEHSETVVMESAVNYRLGNGELKPGRAYLTNERFYVVEIGAAMVTIGMLAGILLSMTVVASIFGLAAGNYVGVALKGSLAGVAGGVAGAWLGGWIERKFPQKPGATVFSARLEDIVSVGDGRFGLRRTLEVASRSGENCAMLLARRGKWKSALSRQTDGA